MSADKYKIDSHKLIYHPERVTDWIKGENIYPVYMEISPIGICNHRCEFCSVDFMGYQNRRLETNLFKRRLTELGKLGVKSIMYAGEGEPFLHKDMTEITLHTKASGIDAAFTTNGVLMSPKISERILPVTEWIKVSCNAGTPANYAKIHRTKPEDFNKTIKNLEQAVKIKKENKYNCTLGMQIILLPCNVEDVVKLTKIAGDIGMDYLVVKPYMPHRDNKHKYEIRYELLKWLEEELKQYSTEAFSVIYRANAMRKWDSKKKLYDKCLALPFWSYIDAGGNVWGCSVFLGEKEFLYGNINKQTFKSIWEGEKRKKSLEWVSQNLDISLCKSACRMDEINRYLWDLKNPPAHVNFI